MLLNLLQYIEISLNNFFKHLLVNEIFLEALKIIDTHLGSIMKFVKDLTDNKTYLIAWKVTMIPEGSIMIKYYIKVYINWKHLGISYVAISIILCPLFKLINIL